MKNGLVYIPLYDYIQLYTRDTRRNNQKFIQFRHKARAYQDSFCNYSQRPEPTTNCSGSQYITDVPQKQVRLAIIYPHLALLDNQVSVDVSGKDILLTKPFRKQK